MRRRRSEPASALDLFLDAVCNAFGGIVLVAILLSIIVQNRTKSPMQSQDNVETMTVEEAQEFLANINRLQSVRLQLSDSVEVLRRLLPKVDLAEVTALQDELQRQQQALNESLQQQTETSQQLAQQVESTSELRDELKNLRDQLVAAQSSLSSDQKALDKALDEQLEILKLPQVESVNKPNVILLMRYGKVYPVYHAGSKLPYDEHVIAERMLSLSKISPKPSGGWDLTNRADAVAFTDYLKAHSPSLNILSAAVWPDSYDDFGEFKRIAIERGFQYQLWPLADVPALLISPTADQLPRVQ